MHGDQVLNLHFLKKSDASNHYERIKKLNNLNCKNESYETKTNAKESVFMRMKWPLFGSHGTAHINFDNDIDPPKAQAMLQRHNPKI